MNRTPETAITLSFNLYFLAAKARVEARYADRIVGHLFVCPDGFHCFRSWAK